MPDNTNDTEEMKKKLKDQPVADTVDWLVMYMSECRRLESRLETIEKKKDGVATPSPQVPPIQPTQSPTPPPQSPAQPQTGQPNAGAKTISPLDIVKRRYALGEISKEDFDQMKADLM